MLLPHCVQFILKFWTSLDKTKPDGLQTKCKDCHKSYVKKHYLENKQSYRESSISRRSKIRSWISNLKSSCGCLFCSEKAYQCLDFHHLDGNEKELTLSEAKNSMSNEDLIKEAKKCIIVCSNCHRKIHANLISCEGVKSNIDDKKLDSLYDINRRIRQS